MNRDSMSGYGLWPLVIFNSALFIIFAFSFAKPQTKRDWRSLGAFAAFILALFTEMYGFPLTVYLLAPWIQSRVPGTNIFSHDAGHILYDLMGWKGDPHLNPLHILSNVLIIAGFFIVSSSWGALHQAQQQRKLAVTGPYAYVRHPQYAGFILVMIGFLFQWPTLVTLAMFPILVYMYVRLAHREEAEVRAELPDEYAKYAAEVPAWIPHGKHDLGRSAPKPLAGHP